MRLRLTPQAAADIQSIADYISAVSPRAALAVTDAIEQRLRQLIDHPYSGVMRHDVGEGVRHLVAGRYLALYRVTTGDVEVLRVVHGKRRLKHRDEILMPGIGKNEPRG